MADPLRKPLEPDFTVEPFTEPELPESTADRRRVEPENQKLVDAAESVGSTLGSAVGTIRHRVQSGLEVVKKRSAEKGASVGDLTEKVRDRASEVTEQANRRFQEWSSAAQRRIRTLRVQVHEFSQERPAELILAIGGIAIVAGIILRLWRSNRD
jgi:ElaB/YqjD/DUF883 family membrane-anchored ribosome-binding protein